MRRAFAVRLALAASLRGAVSLILLAANSAMAQELPRVSVSRPIHVEGLTTDPKIPDLLGLSRVRFHGLIALELRTVGYVIADTATRGASPPLVLTGMVKEEVCDDVAPSQCRIAVQWELQEQSGVVVYRTLTRAVDQQPSLDQLRRALVRGALRSLLLRRRFPLRLSEPNREPDEAPQGLLGFKACRREPLELPAQSRAALTGLVLVESGSDLAAGAIVSGDGLILTSARHLDRGAPLRVRFSARQVVPARVVASAPDAGVALLRTEAHTGSSCFGLKTETMTTGSATFGLESELTEDATLSLMRGVADGPVVEAERIWWRVDSRFARHPGAPLLDDKGRVVAVVAASTALPGANALDVRSALTALHLKTADLTDPRLLEDRAAPIEALGYVHDPDDPPFELTRSYTFGTGRAAATIRTASIATSCVGALGVAVTWLRFRGANDMSPADHTRLVVYNDVSWGLLALGAVGVGLSYALPQPHDVVAGHGSASARVTLRVAGSAMALAGEF